jgi:Ca2+-binding EF-hand superfamily protein
MIRSLSGLIAACSLAAVASVGAVEPLPPQDRPEAFRKLDTDKDGFISRQEAAAHPEVSANFDKADRDRDGRLNFEEFETIPLNRSDQPGTFRTPERG